MTSAIPKRIFQVWAGGAELPLLGRASSANARLLNPDFDYAIIDDNFIDDLICRYFDNYREILESFSFPIQRYDFVRYLAIYKMGGFYFDTDVFLASDLSELLKFGCVFPFERLTWSDFLRDYYGMDWEIGNYAFGAAPGHPFIRAVIENCVRAQNDKPWRDSMTRSLPRPLREDLFVIYSTGPGLVSRTLAEYRDTENPVEVLFPENVCDKKNCWNLFGKYGIHLGGGSWRTQHGNVRRRLISFFGRRNEARAIKLAQKIGKTRSVDLIKTRKETP